MLGYLGAAIDAVNDPAVSVRVEAASAIGGWSTLDPAEIDAARRLADDPDPAVKKMARKALRLLSVSPVPVLRGETRGARPVDPFGWAALLERIALGIRETTGNSIVIDVADLGFMDSEAAPVLRRLGQIEGFSIQGMEIFLQNVINEVERHTA